MQLPVGAQPAAGTAGIAPASETAIVCNPLVRGTARRRPALCIAAWLVLIPVPICAQHSEELKQRFLNEAPLAWTKYLESDLRLRGTVVQTNTDLRNRTTKTVEREFKVYGPWALWTEREEVKRENPQWSGTVETAYGTNSRYAFQLMRTSAMGAGWVIEKLQVHGGETISPAWQDPRKYAQLGASGPLRSALTVYPRPLEKMAASGGLRVEEAVPVQREGRTLAQLTISYSPADADDVRISRGTVVVDPERHWVVGEAQLDMEFPSGEVGTVSQSREYVSGIAEVPLLSETRVVVNARPLPRAEEFGIVEPAHHEMVWQYKLDKLEDADEEQFMLSAFGLPEPDLDPRVPLWSWFLVAGLLCLAIAVLWHRWMRSTA